MTLDPEDSLTHFDISLLNGLHRETRAHFRQRGITHLQQIVAMTPEELLQFRYVGKATAAVLHAQARAWVEQRPIWCAKLPHDCKQQTWFFDIETHPKTGDIWSIGWSDHEGETFVVLVNPLAKAITPLTQTIITVPDTDSAWEYFAESVCANQRSIMHWTGFDAGVMKKTAPRNVVFRLEKRLFDLHHAFKRTVQIPAQGTSLKTVAAYMGFRWSGYQDWFMAFQDYQHWLMTGDESRILSACAYQADDVKAMIVVLRWLNSFNP